MTYKDLMVHMKKCEYEEVHCPNFGCEQHYLRKDNKAHQAECKHKVNKCEKCDVFLGNESEEEHDCIVALKKRFEALETLTLGFKNQVKNEMELMTANK